MRAFGRSRERWGLSDTLPEIDSRRDLWGRRNRDSVKTYFRVPASTGQVRAKLRTHWVISEGKWALVGLSFRKTTRD